MMLPRIWAFFACCLAVSANAADLPARLEPDYARAVIAFNRSQFDEALGLLETIIKAAPTAHGALEMRALIEKAQGRGKDALRTYGELVRVAPRERKGKYYYEVGTILHEQKRYAQARPYLEASIAARFNVGGAHYFLGIADYQDKQYEAAERHFLETLDSRANDLKTIANFYLGLIYYKIGYPIGAIRGLKAAREGAEKLRKSNDPQTKKGAEELSNTSKKLLKNLDRIRWFGNVSLMTGYDNNAALLPGSVTAIQQTRGKRTFKEVITAGGGLMTSPARLIQGVVTYRTFMNLNFNNDSKAFDFFSHMPAVFLTYKPYLRLTGGARIEGNYTFQNLAGRESALEFHPYSLTGDIGPYVRYEVNPHLFVQWDSGYRPKKFYGDPERGDDRRSGDGYFFKATAEYTSPSKYLEPTGYVVYEKDRTGGKNFEFHAFGFGLSNDVKFDALNRLTLGIDLNFPIYDAERVPKREDTLLTTRVVYSHLLTKHFSFMADFNYASNRSNLESTFSYNRAFGSIGLNYTF